MSLKPADPRTDVPWFDQSPAEGRIPPSAIRLLENYSGVPQDKIMEHIINLRNEAWKVYQYPCIGQFMFLEAGLNEVSEYNEVVERLRGGQKLLDMACCFGQTIRQLVQDGAPSENLYGCDLQPEFMELGYKLFKDHDKLRSKFLVADIFDPSSPLKDLQGQVDMIYTGHFFHLWGLEHQKIAAKTVASLLQPQAGSMILGRQMGAVEPHEKESATGTMFRHNVETWKALWNEIGEELGVTFKVDARLGDLGNGHFVAGGDSKCLYFSIRRL
jgi:SAM-dependent methyltransferase